ncbi:MAG TPA: DUF1854 domain-containing protein [Tepidisphaeraceae bacterium]|nr:DUF1854 domain-containing protein [Tepidisphaeraceae bacterium]
MSQTFQFIEDEQQKLNLRRPGQEDVKDVRIRRSFPWSKPGQFVSVRSSDGKELLLIEDVSALDSEMRSKIESWLNRYSFIPRITHIDEVDLRFGYQQWKVQTDRGPAEFRVQEREDIRFLNDGRFSVKDADGNVYELTRLDQLDQHSRGQLESLL